ncbi:MAG: aminoglycoside phosphotransferase family protein [Clostridiales bacterium]|jgi:Ser/Thr protein kinase RdoA (MazF antagonist)|nr:aminoglycoside phosphotransferase family protein [Clostridiales bacterium]
MEISTETLKLTAEKFAFDGAAEKFERISVGNINETYIVTCSSGRRYILQRVNKEVFGAEGGVYAMLENTERVIAHLKAKITARGGESRRERLSMVRTTDGKLHAETEGEVWRVYHYIEGTVHYQSPPGYEHAAEAGRVYGDFFSLMSTFPIESLKPSIVNWHDTEHYFSELKAAVSEDPLGRAVSCQDEIRRILKHSGDCLNFYKKIVKLPKRVTHGDTKFSNLLFDAKTDKALCVADLDTVGLGYAPMDFGDSVRSACNAEPYVPGKPADTAKIGLDEQAFDAFTTAFLTEAASALSDEEKQALPQAVIVVTFELAARYLTDYLRGDKYFKISEEAQNLGKARNLTHLLDDMIYKSIWINSAVRRILGKI